MEERVAQEKFVRCHCCGHFSGRVWLGEVYFHVVFTIDRVSVTKTIKTSNRQELFQILTRTPAFLILLFVIFLSPQNKLLCKTWPLPSTSFAIHYLLVIISSTIYSMKYQQRTEICICTYFAASLSPYGTLETFLCYCYFFRRSCLFVCLFLVLQPPVGQGLLIHEVSRSHTHDVPQSVGLLWTSDQLVAETSAWQHTTLKTDRHPCPRWDSSPQYHQASGRRPTP